MDIKAILAAEQRQHAAQEAAAAQQMQMQPQMPTPRDDSGEYVLPVPFSPTQHLLLKAIISSHYSELLAYFSDEDAPDAARTERALMSLGKMADNITNVCVHPALLIEQYMPNNLLARDTPANLARNSGLFQLLGKIVYLTSEMNLHIGLVAKSGATTNLLEAFLMDKPVNCYRFSGQPLREFRTQRTNCTTFYLVPSSLQYLSAAINTAFDLMLIVDNTFDLSSDYAHGVRSQLRDPTVRRPMAPVVSLLPLNSLMHAQLSTPQSGIDALASAVVFSGRAGDIPPEIAHVLDKDQQELLQWFASPDSPWPLGRTNRLPSVNHRQVYETLMQTPDVDAAHQEVPAHKRTKFESTDGFTVKLVEMYDKLRASQAHILSELESFRATATGRENALDEARQQIIRLTINERTKLDKSDAHEGRAKRYKAELEESRQHVSELTAKLEMLAAGESEFDAESVRAKFLAAIKENEALKREIDAVKARLESQESISEHLKAEFFQATTKIGSLNAQLEQQKSETETYKEQAAGQFVKFKELSLKAELERRDERIADLEAKLSCLNFLEKATSLSRESSAAGAVRRNNRSKQTQADQ